MYASKHEYHDGWQSITLLPPEVETRKKGLTTLGQSDDKTILCSLIADAVRRPFRYGFKLLSLPESYHGPVFVAAGRVQQESKLENLKLTSGGVTNAGGLSVLDELKVTAGRLEVLCLADCGEHHYLQPHKYADVVGRIISCSARNLRSIHLYALNIRPFLSFVHTFPRLRVLKAWHCSGFLESPCFTLMHSQVLYMELTFPGPISAATMTSLPLRFPSLKRLDLVFEGSAVNAEALRAMGTRLFACLPSLVKIVIFDSDYDNSDDHLIFNSMSELHALQEWGRANRNLAAVYFEHESSQFSYARRAWKRYDNEWSPVETDELDEIARGEDRFYMELEL